MVDDTGEDLEVDDGLVAARGNSRGLNLEKHPARALGGREEEKWPRRTRTEQENGNGSVTRESEINKAGRSTVGILDLLGLLGRLGGRRVVHLTPHRAKWDQRPRAK